MSASIPQNASDRSTAVESRMLAKVTAQNASLAFWATSIHPAISCLAIRRGMKVNILEDLLHQELRSLYSTEKQTFKELSKMTRAACHPKLRMMLRERLEESGDQVKRLERMAGLIGKSLEGARCQGIRQVVEEEARESLLNARARNETYDAGLIAAARHFICYEIEKYELACILASRLGLDELELLLQQNMKEQKELSGRMARLAKSLMEARMTKACTSKHSTDPIHGSWLAA